MPRIGSSVALVAALVVSVALGSSVLAQGQATDEHPIVGSWIVDPTPDDPSDAPELDTFHSDGTFRGVQVQGTSVGVWQPSDDRGAEVAIRFHLVLPEVGFVGLGTVRGNITVSEDGQSFTGTYTVEFPTGGPFPPGELGPSDVTGERIPFEEMGEPVGPLPTPPPAAASPAGTVEAGSPAPATTAPGQGATPAPATSPIVLEVSPPAGSLPLPDPAESPAA